MDDPEFENIAQTVRDIMSTAGSHQQIELPVGMSIDAPNLISLPANRKVEDLTNLFRQVEEFLKPHRRKGTAHLDELSSLIGWANRFKGESSALFAKPDMSAASLTCIADYHAEGPVDLGEKGDATARHCHHRAVYKFPMSDEWKAWMGVTGQPMEKDDLGEFIEAQAKDIMDPTPAILKGTEAKDNADWENRLIRTAKQIEGRFGQLTQLLAMSKKFQVYETSDLTVTANRDTGEASIQFLNEHKDSDGKPLSIPNLIIIAIPVFLGGAPYRMPVRFRYRKQGGAVKFILSVYNPERAFEAAFREAIATAQEETQLPLFLGSPES